MAFAKDLRASVLQAAMQGKLTEQLETDTPVSELLNKMNIKPKYSEDGIAPNSWQWVEMQDIVKLEKGEKTENKKLPYLEARYLRTGNDAKMYTSGEFVAKGTNVILVDGENSGEVFLVPEDGYMGSTFKVLSINSKMDKDFILKILLFYKDMFRQSKKGSAIPHLNKKLFKELMVAVPPIEEQKRIVRRIEEIMIRINELEAIEEELKKLKEVFPADMKAAVLQAAMQGKLTEQLDTDGSVDELLENIKAEREKLVKEGKIKKSKTIQNDNFVALEDAPFDIPSSWKWVVFEDVGYFISGYTPESEYINTINGIPYFKVGDMNTVGNEVYLNITNNFVNKEKCRTFSRNTIVYPKNGGAIFTNKRRLLAQDSVVDLNTGGFCCLNQDCLKYMFLFLQTLDFSHYYKGSALPTLDMDKIKQIPIPLPPIEEQQRIVDKLETILPLIEDI